MNGFRKISGKIIGVVVVLSGICTATNYYVAPAPTGNNSNNGTTTTSPFLTIQNAANAMQAGDTCYIRTGTYRELINPPHGGTSESARITYIAYPGETPKIKGSNQFTSWVLDAGNVWKVTIADAVFNGFNPYTTMVAGPWLDWSNAHLGDVFFNETPFLETLSLTTVQNTVNTWYTANSSGITTIYANFGGANPNNGLAEVTMRPSVFTPSTQGLKYITINGLTMMHAATNWNASETVALGLVSTYWGYAWNILNCHISDSKCCGIASGKNTSSSIGNFTYSAIGHHLCQGNVIERCGETGIYGGYNWSASTISNNLIQDINFQGLFAGQEQAGIKVHYTVDLVIKNNIIRRVRALNAHAGENFPGIWIDWANQGIRITGNVIYNCDAHLIYTERNTAPFLIDNNVLIGTPCRNHSNSEVWVHNLFFKSKPIYQDWTTDPYSVNYYTPHTGTRAGSIQPACISDRYFNNIYMYNSAGAINNILPSGSANPYQPNDYREDYNMFYNGTTALTNIGTCDQNSLFDTSTATNLTVTDLPNGVRLTFATSPALRQIATPVISTSYIGQLPPTNYTLQNNDASDVTINRDIFGKTRSSTHPVVGPFEDISTSNTYVFTAGPNQQFETDPNQVSIPITSPLPGEYVTIQTVSLSCPISGATVRYTTDGSIPTSSSTAYTNALTIDRTTTINAKAFKTGMTDSPLFTAIFTIRTGTPQFSQPPGLFTTVPVTISVTSATPSATIRYTLDGTGPDKTIGTIYTAPIILSTPKTIKAIAYYGSMDNSRVASGLFNVSDSAIADTTTHTSGVSTYLPIQTNLIPCLFRSSTWNTLVVTFSCVEITPSGTGLGEWLGFTLFDQGPALNLASLAAFPSHCLTIGHTGTNGNLSIWIKSGKTAPHKSITMPSFLPWSNGTYTGSYQITLTKIANGAVQLYVAILNGPTSIGQITDTINATQWNAIDSAGGLSISGAGRSNNSGSTIAIKNISVSRQGSATIGVVPFLARQPEMATSIRHTATGFVVTVGEQSSHQVTVFNLAGKAVFSRFGAGQCVYEVPKKNIAKGVLLVMIQTTKNRVEKMIWNY